MLDPRTSNKLPAISVFSFFILLTILPSKAQAQHHPTDRSEIIDYVDFLKKQDQSPTDYILRLFETNDIVILCERVHPESTHYDMILKLVSDPAFIDKVGHIFTELGVSSLSDQMESYLTDKEYSEKQSREQLQYIYRNLTFHPVWDNTNYYNFPQDIRKLNMKLEVSKEIHIYPSDIPFNWQDMNEEKYPSFRSSLLDRDKIMAEQIGVVFDSICILPGSSDNKVLYTAISDGKCDAAFEVLGNPGVGFSFLDSPFGADSFGFFPVSQITS